MDGLTEDRVMSFFWIACLGDEVDTPVGKASTLDEAKEICDRHFREAIPWDSEFWFVVTGSAAPSDILYQSDVIEVAPQFRTPHV